MKSLLAFVEQQLHRTGLTPGESMENYHDEPLPSCFDRTASPRLDTGCPTERRTGGGEQLPTAGVSRMGQCKWLHKHSSMLRRQLFLDMLR
jgi:hypothetical protein